MTIHSGAISSSKEYAGYITHSNMLNTLVKYDLTEEYLHDTLGFKLHYLIADVCEFLSDCIGSAEGNYYE